MTSYLTAYDMLTLALLGYFQLTIGGLGVLALIAHKNGGVWFARVGRIGGSFYVARRRVCRGGAGDV